MSCLAHSSGDAACGVQDGLCLVWLAVLVMLHVVFKMVCVFLAPSSGDAACGVDDGLCLVWFPVLVVLFVACGW